MADEADQAQAFEQGELERSLTRIQRYEGVSANECVECEAEIPQRRKELIPGVQLCADCQSLNEARARQRGVA